MKETMQRYPAMTGISRKVTAWMNSMPMPGHWNTVSVISANAISEPKFIAVMVTTGIRQLRSAWRK
ncbi:hypothetical protein D9M70_546470 [compost metagenome]